MECTAKSSLVRIYVNSKPPLYRAAVCRWWRRECAHALGEFKKKSGLAMEKKRGCDWITGRFRRTELWRKTYNPEHQALHRVLCTEPSGQYSIQLGQQAAPGVAPLL